MKIFILFLYFLLLSALISLALAAVSLIIWLPTKRRDLDRILRLADLKEGEKFYDLGCGDGKVIFFISQNSPAEVIGLEVAWPLFLVCKIKKLFYRVKPIIKYRDLYKEDLTDAKVVYIFGIPDKLKNKLKPKLEKELKPGSRVISYVFPIGGWRHKLIDQPRDRDVPIYFYVV